MNKDEVKLYLSENPNYIKDILEEIGCHHVKIRSKYVQACRPDGNNPSSIQVNLNRYLTTKVHTRSAEFEKYKNGDFDNDIYSLLDYLCGYNLDQAFKFICGICGIDKSYNISTKKSAAYMFLKKFKRNQSKEINYKEVAIERKELEQFYLTPTKIYEDDGVDLDIQREFELMFDIIGKRILTPIKNSSGEIVTLKGRTIVENYKTKGISKFLYYYPYQGEFYLFGEYENYKYILESEEIFIVESEKAVMQLATMGIRNVLAISKKTISTYQLKKILSYGKRVILCLDNDVTIEEIKNECRKFRNLCEVYYIKDENILGEKDSPTDKGKEVFEYLVKNKVKFKEDNL